MRRAHFRFLAGASCLVTLALAHAASRPRYGGTLRIESSAPLASIDPRNLPADARELAAAQKLIQLVFDRLVLIDDSGRPQPQLALEAHHDAAFKRWRFRLRPGVKFSDGSPLTPEIAAEALQGLGGGRTVSASGGNVVIETPEASPGLPAELAEARNSIFRAGAQGTLLGTGPFRLAEWQPGKHALLAANENDWRGRPFLDAVEVSLAVPPREQMVALELDRADIVEVVPAEVRRLAQPPRRVWSSAPVELLSLAFVAGRPAAEDARIREALARAIDRAPIFNVLLQKLGEPAGGLLPEWLSGYAFLFSTAPDLERARLIAASLPASSRTLTLAYDPTDPVAQSIAERIAVNARDAGVSIQVLGQDSAAANAADARLVRPRLESTDPRTALAGMGKSFQGAETQHRAESASSEELYNLERSMLEGFRVIPLFHLPEAYGLSPRVKNWVSPRAGGWRLEDVWLGADKP